jgi:hypothetical protein
MKELLFAFIVFGALSAFSKEPSTSEMRKIAEKVAQRINNPEMEVQAVNGNIELNGWADTEEEKQRAVKIAEMLLPFQPLPTADRVKRIQAKIPLNDHIIDFIQLKEPMPRPPRRTMCYVLAILPSALTDGEAQAKVCHSDYKRLQVCGLDDETVILPDPDSGGKDRYQVTGHLLSEKSGSVNVEMKKITEAGAVSLQASRGLREHDPFIKFADVRSLDKSKAYTILMRVVIYVSHSASAADDCVADTSKQASSSKVNGARGGT